MVYVIDEITVACYLEPGAEGPVWASSPCGHEEVWALQGSLLIGLSS